MPTQARWHLRYLEVVFPSIEQEYLEMHGPAYEDWYETFGSAAEMFNAAALTLRIRFDGHIPGQSAASRHAITKSEAWMILTSYCRTAIPFRKLQRLGLKRLVVDVASPYANSQRAIRDPDWLREQEKRIQDTIEKGLMEDKSYDSSKLRDALVLSQWRIMRLYT